MTTSANMAKRFVAPTFSSVPQTVSFAQDGVIPPIRYASLGETGFAQSRETALEIVEDVFDVLGADGQTDRALVMPWSSSSSGVS